MHAPGSPKALERIPPARGPGQGPNPESSPEGSLGGAADAHRGSIEHVRRVLSTGDAGLTCQQPAERRGGSAGQHRNSPRPGRADDESGSMVERTRKTFAVSRGAHSNHFALFILHFLLCTVFQPARESSHGRHSQSSRAAVFRHQSGRLLGLTFGRRTEPRQHPSICHSGGRKRQRWLHDVGYSIARPLPWRSPHCFNARKLTAEPIRQHANAGRDAVSSPARIAPVKQGAA